VSRKDGIDCRVPIFSYDHGKWIYIRRPYNSNIEIERNGMNGMTNRLLRFTLTYNYLFS